MSFDGSFVLQSAVERFLSRCSRLRSVPELASLSQKGDHLTEDELVDTIADPFLHPSYTIPIVGCFRPLARRIVLGAIRKLQNVDASFLQSDSSECEEEVGEDDIHVVEFYAGRGRGLRLHEVASLSFCRALDLVPFLLRNSYVLSYFRSSPPFRRLLSNGAASYFSGKGVSQLLEIIRISYRFLLMDPKVFSELWNWSCFLDLVEKILNEAIPSVNDNILDIRWCTVQILSVVLRLTDRVIGSFRLEADEVFECLLRWEGFCCDTSLEKAGCYFQIANEGNGGRLDDVINFRQCIESFESDSSPKLNKVEAQRRNCSDSLKLCGNHFVLVATIKKSFEMVLMAVSQRWPVLLHGPAGAGKTALIKYLADISRNQVLFIHMDEQMDSKTLVGSYICSENPGEFRWQPGSLTQAILNGFWVVIEDIDKAPNEVQSLLLPLLEGSSSFATGHGEVISVAESFRLFATVSTLKHEVCQGLEGKSLFSVLWRKVMVGTLNSTDMEDIVKEWFPSIKSFSSRLVETYERVSSGQIGEIQEGRKLLMGTLSRISIRDLLKWCKRITVLGPNFSGGKSPDFDCQRIYQEAVDIFTAFLPSTADRLLVMQEIARIWQVVEPRIGVPKELYPPSKPDIQSLGSDLQVGRVALQCRGVPSYSKKKTFVRLRSSLHILEKIACSVKCNEPVLLVGETGTGKTTLVQYLATKLGQPLTVMNLSQQSDVADLLGGFKPTDARSICLPLYHECKMLFCRTFSQKQNAEIFHKCECYVMEKKWRRLLKVCQLLVRAVLKHESSVGFKRKRDSCEVENISVRLDNACKQIGSSAGMSFKFVEGAFITALRNGHWILLDEVNLAPPETLQRIIGVLDGEKGTLCLTERGDVDYVDRHPQFRLFACMNPATDAGKRELPYSFRTRLTEYFVDDVFDDDDLNLFVNQYLDENFRGEMSGKIVQFYKAAKNKSEVNLQDGANQKPQFSLRSLARALEYTKKSEKECGFHRAIFDGFCMFFLTLLDGPSAKIMKEMILKDLLNVKSHPAIKDDFFIEKIRSSVLLESDNFKKNYVLTTSVKEHLNDLARAVYIKRYPVLLQGPTSSGKTSLVQYLATLTGHEFLRINNHEHTDLQEYLGSYVTDSQGRLRFQEGVLVKAVRNGYWIVLDELNLAPSDVLEALNRLLDDNREIFVPETQETVSAHPDFMLFATQNPPMLYGGRKVLSRAFRNRFLEIHVDEIPDGELTEILEVRCATPPTRARKMVEVMKDLQLHRQTSNAFAGKHGFITPRDLFRWANRFRMFGTSYEDLAKDGYLLLAERLRDENERNVVLETLRRQLRVDLVIDNLYELEPSQSNDISEFTKSDSFRDIIWTKSMRRLYFLVERCYKLREPVLLIGETGGGKTTVCQLLSTILGIRLHILNCHQYTETSDFIGGFYPVRDRSRLASEFKQHVERLKDSKLFSHVPKEYILSSDILEASSTIKQLNEIEKLVVSLSDVTQQDLDAFIRERTVLLQLQQKWQTIFVWQNGPLVEAMTNGDLLLVDEISLADDSVLERLNSVLEPERTLSLAEKGGPILEKINAHPNFFILATMNPGGDYGKKELSPALRNRFTEIWVSPVSDINELKDIAFSRLRFVNAELSQFADYIINFWQWFNQLQTGRTLTVRDLLSWISFINATASALKPDYAFIHGAFLVLLDGLSLGTGICESDAKKLRELSLSFLLGQVKGCSDFIDSGLDDIKNIENYGWGQTIKLGDQKSCNSQHHFGISPFYIAKGPNVCQSKGFEFVAPTTCRNAMRVLRAMQLRKPVLLEGSPGVGKTSLVVALAEYSGHTVVRINLSEQTDMMDLLGSDLPVEGDNGMEFAWSDGILLQALKDGSWVLLDELNLAPQSVLEGLNAILDHRAEVYIPELGLTYKCPDSFRVFACQNPSSQGGGRKGLPKSFLNRFTKVYIDELSADDYLYICQSRHPTISSTVLSKLISFNNCLHEDVMLSHKYGQEGSPWEFNLRDVFRSCQIIEGAPENAKASSFLNIVYLQRMRTDADRREVIKLYEMVFGESLFITQSPDVYINPHYLVVGSACAERNHFQPQKISKYHLHLLPGMSHAMEAVVHCVQHQWLCVLVGQYSSGKTSLIRLLAQLTGNELTELNLSSATDVSELLGCFEQYNLFRTCRELISQVERYVDEYLALRLEQGWNDLVNKRKSIFTKWLAFLADYRQTSCIETSERSLSILVDIIEILKLDIEEFCLPVSWSYDTLNRTTKAIFGLQKNVKIRQPAKFEWVAGDLIKAIECGGWVVLDNANLCNPTVLDRINSLVEPDGSIMINECGLIDGRPVKLSAHPKFRMFLTVDPKYGEVSRAMRNRGLEIFLMPRSSSVDGEVHDFDDGDISDVRRFLVLSGIPFNKLILVMSKAHIYAKNAGAHLGVRITLLELNRWVQLFQHLLMNGNEPSWSLQLSWDHTYLSSLGEAEGSTIVSQAKLSYLSDNEWLKLDPASGGSLALPGGWPSPHSLGKFLNYSKESCIRQNCLYLEFLGVQCAASELSTHQDCSLTLTMWRNIMPSLVPVDVVRYLMYPQKHEFAAFNLPMVNQKLFFAANWATEQATENDFSLYHQLFKWWNAQLKPHCSFFESFLKILKTERCHPIWDCIFMCREKIFSHYKINLDKQIVPLLSLRLFELVGLDESLQECKILLNNAIRCVPLLRHTFHQWNVEADHLSSGGPFQLLKLLQGLESEVLREITKAPEIVEIYADLLEHHKLFWREITSSNFEHASLIWHWLMKVATKLQPGFSEKVGALLVGSSNFNRNLGFITNTKTSTLWIRGGHPTIPSSVDIYHEVQRLFCFCDNIWPRKNNNIMSDKVQVMEDVLSANNFEFRKITLQALSMSSCIITNAGRDPAEIRQQLEELYQGLHVQFEHMKKNIQATILSIDRSKDPALELSDTPCCTFSDEVLCRKSVLSIWGAILPLFDRKSLSLDIKLLEELSNCLLVNPEEAHQILLSNSSFLEHVLDYSLYLSSRPPADFSPHQNILWLLDAWKSIDSVHSKMASTVLEMWFRWHSSLWNFCSKTLKMFFPDSFNGSCHLMHLTRMTILKEILDDTFSIKDYDAQRFKLRVLSCFLWHDFPLQGNFVSVLLSAADNLFKQIIFVHRKFFDEDTFGKIKLVFSEFKENGASQKQLQDLKLLISSSRSSILASDLSPIIKMLLEDLYGEHPPSDSLYHLGSAWVHIGALRFHLLLNSGGPDPALKYALKHSLTVEKISLFDLEIKVRRECEHLAGRSPTRADEQRRLSRLQKLDIERKQILPKVVFRPHPSKYEELRRECDYFLEKVSSCKALVVELKSSGDIPAVTDRADNLQVTLSSFIARLSNAYAEYEDLIQPIQVAIYEMKLGLSLAISDALDRAYKKVDREDNQRILATVHTVMQFPVEIPPRFIPDYIHTVTVPYKLGPSKTIRIIDINFLKMLVGVASEVNSDKALQGTVYHIVLIALAHHTSSSLLIDKDTFLLLIEIFNHFVRQWLEMKSENKVKEADEAQFYKFRARSIKIENIIEGKYSLRYMPDSDATLTSEHEEMLMEQEFMHNQPAEDEDMEEEWRLIPEAILKSLVLIHSQLFSLSDLSRCPGSHKINTEYRLRSFLDSYNMGSKIMKGMQTLPHSALDDSLTLEHLLYVCLQYEQTSGLTSQKIGLYNTYKDSNPSVMSKMVKPLITVQEKVLSLLEEWPEHPGLQKLSDVAHKLLTIPQTTPLSKALLGLQLLHSRAQSLQENFSRCSLDDELKPIGNLVTSWQKLEVDCWPVLLDDVQEQYHTSAGTLWFPLHAVLCRSLSGDYNIEDMKQRVEEFILSSTVGEFKRRLQLLLAFHGQLNHGICLQAYSSPHLKENLDVMYNAFGYYVQYLPVTLEHIQSGRTSIEKELKEYVKLFKWEQSSIEKFRRTRQKIWKLIKKFNDVLQEPFMIILEQDKTLKREKDPSWLERRILDDDNTDVLQFPFGLLQLRDTERFLWREDLKMKADSALQFTSHGSSFHADYLKRIADSIRMFLSSQSTFGDFIGAWNKGWDSLQDICVNAAEFAHVWKYETNNLKKSRALVELLKTLERCGLSKRRPLVTKLDGLKATDASTYFSYPSYDVLHLLRSESCQSSKVSDILLKSTDERSWEAANEFHFKNLGMLLQMQRDFSCHKRALNLEQVKQAVSFIDHLVITLQEQRFSAYGVSENLKKLRQQMYSLSCTEVGGGCSVAPDQHAILKCLWLHKHLLDNLLAMLNDTKSLLLGIRHNHKNTCFMVRNDAETMFALVDKFIPIFTQSKESLDKCLLGSSQDIMISSRCMLFIASKQMKQLAVSNFEILDSFERDIKNLRLKNASKRSVLESLLNRLEELIVKGKFIKADFSSEVEANSQSGPEGQSFNELNSAFTGAIKEINKLLIDAFENMNLLQRGIRQLSAEKLTSWKDLFESSVENLRSDRLYDALRTTIAAASKLIDCIGTRRPEIFSQIEMHLKGLYVLLDLLLTYGEGLISEFLDAHKAISEVTHVLAHIFILLFNKGFGTAEEPTEDTGRPEDACGTGMGEGEGTKDVSDQIDDEAQLLGTSNQVSIEIFYQQDGLDNSEKVENNKDKGIEMDEDFAADTFSVSEDSGESDDENEQDVDLESKMGETGDNKQVVDEKLWDKDEDDKLENAAEKYESGPSVNETDITDRELRAKEDNSPSPGESELDNGEPDKPHQGDNDHNISDDENNVDDKSLDKENAYEDPTGIQVNEPAQDLDDADMDEPQGSDREEETNSDGEAIDDGELSNPAEQMDDKNSIQMDDNGECKENAEDTESADLDVELNNENITSDMMDSSDYLLLDDGSLEPKMEDCTMEPEPHYSNSCDVSSHLAPSRSSRFDQTPNTELSVPDSGESSRLASNQMKPQPSQGDPASVPKSVSNPYRSIGDAMKDWKERVQVTTEPQEDQQEGLEDIEDENAAEYRYVSETEKSTSQALGSATAEQIKDNVECNKAREDDGDIRREKIEEKELGEENPDTCQITMIPHPAAPQKKDEKIFDTVMSDDEIMEDVQQDSAANPSQDLVSFQSSYTTENEVPHGSLDSRTVLWKPVNLGDLSDVAKKNAMAEWKRCELSTAKLSQELAEQLRLIMEPTLASKLQGDYRTGKRINMKKVIPYIASHYRKDKIWLRRTRPNKRDYQVVIAIDDSRSMSESGCGNAAIESLVTICRAMSQLEVGQFAVASFGEMGNIKLLHDFDQPFTGEAGLKMISSLSFKQDNTITDEPVVDLLKHLNGMLDSAVAKARSPSGQNPLNQLILILSDGRFNQKENLKRYVRDTLNRRRMVAFVLLDSPKESILDLEEILFEEKKLTRRKYLSSFPFPYYILLKNMNSLPYALGDLLRQWFELMRSTSE